MKMALSAGSLHPGRHIEWPAEAPTALWLSSLPLGHLRAASVFGRHKRPRLPISRGPAQSSPSEVLCGVYRPS